jgi:hypothetical protein
MGKVNKLRNAWPERAHNLEWLVEKFWPVPTWPDNWLDLQRVYEAGHPWTP